MEQGSSGRRDSAYGIGGKADGSSCDPDSDRFCWTQEQSRALVELRKTQQDVLAGIGDPKAKLQEMIALSRTLDPKLRAEERSARDQVAERVASLSGDASRERHAELLGDLIESISRAMVDSALTHVMGPAEWAMAQLQTSDGPAVAKADTGGSDTAPEATDNEHINPQMREVLDRFKNAGPVGWSYVQLIQRTGVLERDYSEYNAHFFGEQVGHEDAPIGISREERVRRIVEHAKWEAAMVGAMAGAETVIPFVGGGVSVAHETVELFRVRMTMALQIAEVHGWNIQRPSQLGRLLRIYISSDFQDFSLDILATNAALPLVTTKLGRYFNVDLADAKLKRFAKNSWTKGKNLFNRVFRKAAAKRMRRAATEKGIKAVAKEIASWGAVLLNVAASAATDYITTQWLGDRIHVASKRWLADLMVEGTTYLSRPRQRDCFFQALSAMVWADGEASRREKLLYQAFLGKKYTAFSGLENQEGTRFPLEPIQQRDYACTLSEAEDAGTEGAKSCLFDSYEHSHSQHRLTVLAYLYAMMGVDLLYSDEEQELYRAIREDFSAARQTRGAAQAYESEQEETAIDPGRLDYVEQVVNATLQPSTVYGSEGEVQAFIDELMPEDMLDYLDSPKPQVQEEFDLGFAQGVCP